MHFVVHSLNNFFFKKTSRLILRLDFNKRFLLFSLNEAALSPSSQSWRCFADRKKTINEGDLTVHSYFDIKDKNKEAFIEAIHKYRDRERLLRGHVEFIYACLKYMDDFGVQKDLEVYKAILDLMPKGKMIPNVYQRMFYHYPKHQDCAVDVLCKMEHNGVMGDRELQNILFNTFGFAGHPTTKFARMMYWMPKFKHTCPWPLPERMPNDALELAKMALTQINSVDPASYLTVMQTSDLEDDTENTWIVSAISPAQNNLVVQHDRTQPLKVEGPFGVFLRDERIAYFVLRADPKPIPRAPKRSEEDDVTSLFMWMTEEGKPKERELITARTIHEQEDAVIIASCATGTSSLSSVLSWIRLLERSVPELEGVPILFAPSSPIGEVIVSSDEPNPTPHSSPDSGESRAPQVGSET